MINYFSPYVNPSNLGKIDPCSKLVVAVQSNKRFDKQIAIPHIFPQYNIKHDIKANRLVQK